MQAQDTVQPGARVAPPRAASTVPAGSLPGPRTPALLQTLSWGFGSPLGLYRAYGARYGATFRLRLISPPGTRRVGENESRLWDRDWTSTLVVVSTPAQLRAVYDQPQTDLGVGAAYTLLKRFLGADMLITNDGAVRQQERRLLQPIVSQNALAIYDDIVRATVGRAIQRLPDRATVSLTRVVTEIAAEVVLEVMFGMRGDAERLRLRRLMSETLPSLVALWPILIPMLQRDLGPWTPGGRARRTHAELIAWLGQEVASRRASGSAGKDMLGRLLDSYDALDVPANLAHLTGQIVLLLASARPLGTALVWCFYNTIRNPAICAAARQAARENAELGGEYLDAACKESLRLNPPFIGAIRRATTDVDVDGIAVPRGMYVVPCFYLTHLLPEIFPRPHEFLPERFLGKSYSPFEYAPLGGGVRRCLGYPFVMRAMPIIMGEIFRAFDIEPAASWSGRDHVRGVMIMPRDQLRAHLRRIGNAPLPAHAQ